MYAPAKPEITDSKFIGEVVGYRFPLVSASSLLCEKIKDTWYRCLFLTLSFSSRSSPSWSSFFCFTPSISQLLLFYLQFSVFRFGSGGCLLLAEVISPTPAPLPFEKLQCSRTSHSKSLSPSTIILVRLQISRAITRNRGHRVSFNKSRYTGSMIALSCPRKMLAKRFSKDLGII